MADCGVVGSCDKAKVVMKKDEFIEPKSGEEVVEVVLSSMWARSEFPSPNSLMKNLFLSSEQTSQNRRTPGLIYSSYL